MTYEERIQQAVAQLEALKQEIHAQPYQAEMCGSCRKVHGHSESCEIPAVPVYVCSNDSFMSGWGHARGRINVCVVPCASADEAKKVVEYIESRSDQKRVRVCYTKPQPRGRKLSLLLAWRENALQGYRHTESGLARLVDYEHAS